MAESDPPIEPELFRPGRELREAQGTAALIAGELALRGAPIEAYVVTQVLEKDRAFRLWNEFIQLKQELLQDPNCFDWIQGSREMNRTGATRLATAFGLSLETLRVDETEFKDDRRFTVRVRASRGPRYADGIASCRVSEIPAMTNPKGKPGDPDYRPPQPVPYSQREHFALTRADTRARKRAIADILGGTEAE